MKNKIKNQIIPSAYILLLLLSSCGKQSDCEIPSRHVHKYTKSITDEINIEIFKENEVLNDWGYKWNSDYIEITQNDSQLYDVLNRNGLFDGINNYDYLYYLMKNNNDYLMFYYEYETTETYTVTNEDGETELKTRKVKKDGWHNDSRDSDNTGEVRLYHHKYFGYRIVNINGKFKVEKSPLVDDIREIIDDYPYFKEDCYEEVYKTFKFKKSELKDLSPDDFDEFDHPNLDEKTLVLK